MNNINRDAITKRIASLSPEQRALFELRLKEKELSLKKTTSIPQRKASDTLSLSLVQERLWFLHQLQPDIPLYNESSVFEVTGHLNSLILEKSINEIIKRHEILRTSFQVIDGQPTPVILPSLKFTLATVNLQDWSETEQEELVKQTITEHSSQPFDLTREPLLRGTLIQLTPQENVILLTMHHIISDGWSWRVFYQELAALYQAFYNNSASPLPEIPIQYADFALWQKQSLDNKTYQSQLAYWKQKLNNLPPILTLPTDNPRPAIQSFRGARASLVLPDTLTNELRFLSQKEGVTLFMLLLAAFKTLLYRYTGEIDLVVGTPIANRNQIETENLLGCFVNTLVLRTDISGNLNFRELLGRIRETTLEAYAHQDLPFERLVQELQPERALSHTPLFQVMFVFQDAPLQALELPSLKLIPLIVDSGVAKFDLTLFLEDTKHGLMGALEYNTDLFQANTITRMLGHFQTLLEGIVANPIEKLSKLALLTPQERHQLLIEFNQNQFNLHDSASSVNAKNLSTHIAFQANIEQCLHHLFEIQVEKTPDNVAVVFEDKQLTYYELNCRANQLAHYLQLLGVKPEVSVCVCLERSLEMVIALLGILKAGGAYIPLAADYPPERLAFIVDDTQAPILLTQQSLSINFSQYQAQLICLDTDWENIIQHSQDNPVAKITPDNLAYIIYTSGSTGTPKGAMNTHRGICNRILWMQEAYQLTETDSVLQKTPFSFDVSVWEFFWTLSTGARLVMAQPGGHKDSSYLVKLIRQQEITTLHFVPSMLQIFLAEEGLKTLTSIKRVFCSGEALPFELQKRFFASLDAELHNLYGPTEAAVDVTFWKCQQESQQSIVPIGRPIANTKIYLLDTYLQPVPIGIPGDLYIGGVGLARGYLNRPNITAERFIPNPFSDTWGTRLYKTGDLAKYLPDGNIVFLGRIDNQVKVRGFRIELGEIESVLGQHPAVREVVVTVQNLQSNYPSLIAYLVSNQSPAPSISQLRSFLQERLPEYMIPAAFVLMNALPLLPNGKVNRRALPAPPAHPELETTFLAPNTPITEMLAGIWKQILGIQQVGIHDNFFELGGHSLLATQVISQVRKTTQVELPLRCFFENPTVARLAEQVEIAMKAQPQLLSLPIQRVSPQLELLPLSFAQQRLWFLHQLDPDSSAYNDSNTVLLQGLLNIPALLASLNEIVRRHEALRTSFAVVNGQAVQKILPSLTVSLPIINLQNFSEIERQAEIQRLERANAQQPFDLKQASLLRLTLLQLSATEHILLVTMHHIISDAWSGGVFIREVSALYEAFSTGKPSPLPELPIQYADYAIWQQHWLQGEVLATQLEYWKKQLEGAKTLLQLPTDRPRTDLQTSIGTKYSFALSPELSHSLKMLSQQEGVTMFMTLLATFNTLLYHYTRQEDILVGSPIANRNRSEVEGLIGFFVNTLVLRTNLSKNPTFRELLQQVREVALGAYSHQDLPFEKLVAELQPERDRDRSPLFQVWFVLQNAPVSNLELEGLNLSLLDTESGMVRHDLKLDLSETIEGIKGFFEYKIDLFEVSTIAQMVELFKMILTTVVEQPNIQLNELGGILNEAEKERELLNSQELQKARRQKLGKVSRKAISDNN
jgi:amino acid adenylation domain-containing protein